MELLQENRESIIVAGEELVPLPDRSLLWPAENTLFVADVHLGKGAAFRAGAVPVPTGSTQTTLNRLFNSVAETKVSRLVILGDLWHAAAGRTEGHLTLFQQWREQFPVQNPPLGLSQIILVEGNHDVKSGRLPENHGVIQVKPGTRLGPFCLQHEPYEPADGYGLAGHLHPGARLIGKADQRFILPCFWFQSKCAVLPSFGDFTGMCRIRPAAADDIFAICHDRVVHL